MLGLAHGQGMSTADWEPEITPAEGVLTLCGTRGTGPSDRPPGPTSIIQYWVGSKTVRGLGGRRCNSASQNLWLAPADLITR